MSLEAGDAALEQALSQPSSVESSPPARDTSTSEPSQPERSEPESSGQPTLMELDKLEKFKFEGREMTLEQLRSERMMQQDYSRKTAEIAQERRYYDNLRADLESVRNDPSLAAKFKELYPQKFHDYLKYAESGKPAAETNQVPQQPTVPPELLTQIKELRDFKTQFETKALEAEIDSAFSDMTKKYPMADEMNVTARADLALRQGVPLRTEDGKVNVAELEKIFKAEHERTKKAFETHYKNQFEQQKAAGSKARDVPGGGGVPGQAPEKMSFDQATQKAIRDLSARQ